MGANPVATLAAHEAARLLVGRVRRRGEPDRDALALGALLAGYAIDSTGYGLHHVLAQTLVQRGLAAHGPANAVLLPHTLAALARRAPRQLEALADALGEDPAAAAARLCARTGATRLRDLGIDGRGRSTPAPTPPRRARSSTTRRRAPTARSSARSTPPPGDARGLARAHPHDDPVGRGRRPVLRRADPARPGPGFEPPADPGAGGPSVHGLSLVARIMRGRELAAEAAGIPPLDSDQVLDLQRTAGNSLTTSALSRWTDLLEAALAGEEQAALDAVPHRRGRAAPPARRCCSTCSSPPAPPIAAAPRRDRRARSTRSTRRVRVRSAARRAAAAASTLAVERPGRRPRRAAPPTRARACRSSSSSASPTRSARRPRSRRRARSPSRSRASRRRCCRCPFAAPQALQAGDARLVAFAELAADASITQAGRRRSRTRVAARQARARTSAAPRFAPARNTSASSAVTESVTSSAPNAPA